MAAQLVEAGVFPALLSSLVPQIQPQIVEVIVVAMPDQLIVHELPEVQVVERVGRARW